jgi:fatty acid desaturase
MENPLPEKTNLALAAGFATVQLFQYFGLPLLLLPRSPWWGLLLVPIGLLTPPMWALMHEAVHGILLRGGARNDAAGRGLFILFGSPLHLLRFGHLTHHRYNRMPVDLDDGCDPRHGCGALRALGYYFKLFGGTYVQELFLPLLFWLPRRALLRMLAVLLPSDEPSYVQVREHAEARLVDDPAVLRAVRTDTAAVYALFALAFAAYGSDGWMLVSALLLRGFFVSFFDNLYHYATPVGERRYALYPDTPVWLQRYLLNFSFHYVHHLHPAVPWNRLAALAAEEGRVPDMGYFAALLRQLRGPVPIDRLAVLTPRNATAPK